MNELDAAAPGQDVRGVGRERRQPRARRHLRRRRRASVVVRLAPASARGATGDAHAGAGRRHRRPDEQAAHDRGEHAVPELKSAACCAETAKPASGTNGRRRRIRKLRLPALLLILLLLGTASFTLRADHGRREPDPELRSAAGAARGRRAHLRERRPHDPRDAARIGEPHPRSTRTEIAPIMQQAIVAIEDKRFYEHRGVDLRGIGRAVWADVSSKGVVQGGSTITQQFVKNSCVTSKRTISRKLKEAALAWQLEQRWTKDADPHRLPEHDLLRERRVRHPARGADVLQHDGVAARRSPRPRCWPAFPPIRPATTRSTNPKTARGAAARGPAGDARAGRDLARRPPRAPTARRCRSRTTCSSPASRGRRRTSSTTSSSS